MKGSASDDTHSSPCSDAEIHDTGGASTGSPDEALGTLCSVLGLGHDPEAILSSLRAAYDAVDGQVRAHARGIDLPCRSGCDACCHESVFLSGPEFLAVAKDLLHTRAPDERRRIVEEMRALAERFSDELEILLSLEPGEERDEVARRVKFRCPLLDSEGRCTVYGSREMNARTFGLTFDSSSGAPYGCERTHERLRVLPEDTGRTLFDARVARLILSRAVPGTELVHVYPWWFANFGDLLL